MGEDDSCFSNPIAPLGHVTPQDKEDAKPTVYCEEYRNDPEATIAIYDESFFHSSVSEDSELLGTGFEDSIVAVEEEKPLPLWKFPFLVQLVTLSFQQLL